MAKKRNRNRNQTIANKSNNVSDKPEIDYDKLAQSIIKAHLEIDKIKTDMQKKQEDKEKEEFRKYMSYKSSYKSKDGKLSIRRIIQLMINYEPDKIKTTRAIYASMELLTEMTFGISELVCFGMSILSFIGILYLGIFYNNWMGFGFIFFLFMFAFYGLFFRMARKEVSQIKDNSQLISIFSSMTCFVAMIISLISMIIAVVTLLMQMRVV